MLEVKSSEAGFVFLGFGVVAQGLALPGLKRTFDLDFALGVLLLYSGATQNVTGPWITPNDTSLISKEVFLQAIRLQIGPGLKGEFLPVTHVPIAPN